jgi:hypothetical protein
LSVMRTTVCHESNQSVRKHKRKLCCTQDESRPLAIAMQVEIANHPKVLWSKAMVLSVREKGRARLCQVCIKETKTIEPLKKYRKRIGVIKTEGESLTQDKFGGNLFTVRSVTGTKAA